MLEYKHYLQTQFQKIESKILGDQSIQIFKDLQNKEFMNRRVNEIFQKTYHSQRQNYIKTLIQQNNKLKQTIHSLGGSTPPTTHLPSPKTTPIPTNRYQQIESSKLIKQNQDLKLQLNKLQLSLEKQKDKLRKQITQLQQKLKFQQIKFSTHTQEWKQKEAKFMESFKQFLEQNKNLQTEVIDLRGRLDGNKLKQTVVSNDSDNVRRRVKELEMENQELVVDLGNSLNEIKALSQGNNKLVKDYSFIEHKYKLLEEEKERLEKEIENMNEEKNYELNEEYKMMELSLGVKDSLISKMQTSITALNKQLQQKNTEVFIWKQNYESTLKSNNVEKVKMKYEYQILELQNQLNANQQQYQRELQKRSQRANTLMKGEIMGIESLKQKEKGEYSHKIIVLQKEKYELEEQVRGLEKQIDEMESDNRRGKIEIEKEIDRFVVENETMKASLVQKESQYKKNVRGFEEQIEGLKRIGVQKSEEINMLQMQMAKLRRQVKQNKSQSQREKEKNKTSQLLLMKKQFALKDLQKQIQSKQSKYKQLLSTLSIETQQKNELKLRLSEQKSQTTKLTSELSKQKLLLTRSQSLTTEIQLRNRSQIKEIADQYQEEIQRVKSEITIQVHQQMRAMEELTMNEKGKAEIAGKYDKEELTRLYQESNELKEKLGMEQTLRRELAESLKQVQGQIIGIRDGQAVRITQAKRQVQLLQQQNNSILQSLLISKNQNIQYKSKISQFKSQTNLIIKGILKMFWEQIHSLKQQLILFQKQQQHFIDTSRIQLSEKVKHYINTANVKLKQAYNQDYQQVRSKFNGELELQKEEWEQKCRKLELDIMSLEAQRQMERSENSKRMKIKDHQIEHEQGNYDEMLRKNGELESQCAKYPQIIRKLEEKNKELLDLIDVHKYQQNKFRTKYEREQQRMKKLEADYESKMQLHKTKYIQDNQDLFNRYEKSLQDMITKTTISDNSNLEDTVTFKTPVRTRTSITNLRQQISQQQNRLKQFGKF